MKKKNRSTGRPSVSRKDTAYQSPGKEPDSSNNADKAGEYRGLCVNCARRLECPFPHSEGGVWHCEEYVEEV